MHDDRWKDAAAYDRFMGHWSRRLASKFLAWLGVKPGAEWLEIGCGTGSLTRAILEYAQPRSVTACDTAPEFISYCAATLPRENLRLIATPADSLPARPGGYDVVVSSLVLNFLSAPVEALRQMRQVCATDGRVAACVWDYSDGMQFLRCFWDAAAALDPGAVTLHEGRRFPVCHPDALRQSFTAAGLDNIAIHSLTIPTVFASFEEYWAPFLEGTGPAPAYVSSLSPQASERLSERLRAEIGHSADGSIHLQARAWAIKGRPGAV